MLQCNLISTELLKRITIYKEEIEELKVANSDWKSQYEWIRTEKEALEHQAKLFPRS